MWGGGPRRSLPNTGGWAGSGGCVSASKTPEHGLAGGKQPSNWGWINEIAKLNLLLISQCQKTSIKKIKRCEKQIKTRELPENPSQAALSETESA